MGMIIGNRTVGPGGPCFIIAEVGLAHEGSVGMAHAYIDAVAAQGVDAVKFQCHTGQANQPWRVRPEWCQDEDREAYWRRTGFTPAEWHGLAIHAVGRGLEFLCSPFSVEAVEILEPIVPAWKIASGQVTNRAMLEAAGATGKPGIISTGLCDERQASDATLPFEDYGYLVSTPLYPTGGRGGDLLTLSDARQWKTAKMFNDDLPLGDIWQQAEVLGLSDHSGTIYPGIAAAALGASILEVHVTMSRHAYGPDVASSLTMEQLRQLVEGVRFVERAMQPMSEEARQAVEKAREVYMV